MQLFLQTWIALSINVIEAKKSWYIWFMFGKCVNLHKTKTVNMRNREEIQRHPMFRTMETIALYMDRYYLDGVIGLIPGIGDVFSALCALPFVYLSTARRTSPTTKLSSGVSNRSLKTAVWTSSDHNGSCKLSWNGSGKSYTNFIGRCYYDFDLRKTRNI